MKYSSSGAQLLSWGKIVITTVVVILLAILSRVGVFNKLDFFAAPFFTLQKKGNTSLQSIRENLNIFADLHDLRAANTNLITENEDLLAKLLAQEVAGQDAQLITYQSQFDISYELLPARIIISLDLPVGEAMLNKGSNSGVEVGDVVIVGKALIGKVIEVESWRSKVIMTYSNKSQVTVVALGKNTSGIITAGQITKLELTDVLVDDLLDEGDVLVTSNANKDYPPDLLVGKVRKINKIESALTKSADVEPLFDEVEVDRVFVITNYLDN